MRHCEICNKLIEEERAEAVPQTRLCIDHARAIDKYGGEFTMHGSYESTSKQGSLKKNYGGVNIMRVRNADAIEKLRRDYEST
jgi:Prokaryotic dksA/traR C4-type zinc finger